MDRGAKCVDFDAMFLGSIDQFAHAEHVAEEVRLGTANELFDRAYGDRSIDVNSDLSQAVNFGANPPRFESLDAANSIESGRVTSACPRIHRHTTQCVKRFLRLGI